MESPVRVGNVFVPGGLPTITYNPRAELELELQLHDFLDEKRRILSVSGPTKTGKTTMLRNTVKNGLWLSGGTIESLEQFWELVGDLLGVYTGLSETGGWTQGDETQFGGKLGVSSTGVSGDWSTSSERRADQTRSQTRPIAAIAREALLRASSSVLVIDDFHYIPSDVQLQIVRNLKDLIFEGLGVIVAAVPHRAYDVVRVEKEMTGRVQQLNVGFWSTGELQAIASNGFTALNIEDLKSKVGIRLANESFQSPHLMQEFCLALCKENGLRWRADSPVQIQPPPDWVNFFTARASATSRTAFDLLSRGPRQRSDRKERTLRGGQKTDIYGAVLAAIAHTGPLTELTYEQLRASLREVLDSEPPQRHEVTRVLEQMATIAREEIDGEPVVDFVLQPGTLYISDPFFAYYMRWQSELAPC